MLTITCYHKKNQDKASHEGTCDYFEIQSGRLYCYNNSAQGTTMSIEIGRYEVIEIKPVDK